MSILEFLKNLFVKRLEPEKGVVSKKEFEDYPEPWEGTDQAKLKAVVEHYGLSVCADEIVRLARPRIVFSLCEETGHQLPLGQSRAGGAPDLTEEVDWPEWNGRPLSFLCQINLADLAGFKAAEALPSAGLLSFFYDNEEQPWGDLKDLGGWKVFYFGDGLPDLRCVEPPPGLGSDHRFKPCTMEFSESISIPGADHFHRWVKNLEDDEWDGYCALIDYLYDPGLAGVRQHRILGHPAEVQGHMELSCQLASIGIDDSEIYDQRDPRIKENEQYIGDWKLLLQLDSDDAAEMMWGDVGSLYFWIRDQDLVQRDFSRCWMFLQCS